MSLQSARVSLKGDATVGEQEVAAQVHLPVKSMWVLLAAAVQNPGLAHLFLPLLMDKSLASDFPAFAVVLLRIRTYNDRSMHVTQY